MISGGIQTFLPIKQLSGFEYKTEMQKLKKKKEIPFGLFESNYGY